MRAFGFYFGQGTLEGINVPQSVHMTTPRPTPRAEAPHDNKPLPPIGRANLQDPRCPDSVDYATDGASQADYDNGNNDAVVNQSAYAYAQYQHTISPVMTRSLGRSMMYAVKSAWIHSHGGLGYPADYGFGPGDHKDEITPQIYMRPGVRPLRQSSVIPNPSNAYK